MNQVVFHGESSGGPSGLPLKRRRGRPRKNPTLKQAKATICPPGFEGLKENNPQRANSTVGIDYMVGQTVTGVIEATFDAGYLLNVKIGNSSMNLRGVVFKPGHYVPITAENDVAPHVQMIRRNNVQLPTENQNRSLAPLKRKYGMPKSSPAPSIPPVGVRGNVVPVVLQPVNRPNGSNPNQMSLNAAQTGHVLDFGDKSVHMVEPISMLPPDRSIPVGEIFATTQSPILNQRVTEGGKENHNGSVNESISQVGRDDKTKPTTSMETDTSGSAESSDTKTGSGKEALKSPEDSGIVSKQETGNINEPFSVGLLQAASIATPPLFRYGTGRMTELLQAVQENMKDKQVQMAEQPTSASEVEFNQTRMNETRTDNEAKVP